MGFFEVLEKLIKLTISRRVDRICHRFISARLVLTLCTAASFIAGVRFGLASLSLWAIAALVGLVADDLEGDDYPWTAMSIRHALHWLKWLPSFLGMAAKLHAPWLVPFYCLGFFATSTPLVLAIALESWGNLAPSPEVG